MATVNCTRCDQAGEGLAEAPYSDALGQEVLQNTCARCWKEWLDMQVKLINEYQLLPVNPEHGAVLERNLKAFLKLPSAEAEGADEIGIPPE